MRTIAVRTESDDVPGAATRTFHAVTNAVAHVQTIKDTNALSGFVVSHHRTFGNATLDICGHGSTGLDVSGPGSPWRTTDLRPDFESGPKTSSSICRSGYDDLRLWNWIGKFVRGPDCRAIRALMGNSLSACAEAEFIADPSVLRPLRKKRTFATFQVRPRQPRRDIGPACVAVPNVPREHQPGWELRTLCRGHCA